MVVKNRVAEKPFFLYAEQHINNKRKEVCLKNWF